MAKATQNTKKASPKAAPKADNKKTAKTAKPAAKTAKTAKTTDKKEKSGSPAKRKTYNGALIIFYGGALKVSHLVVTSIEGAYKKEDVIAHVNSEYASYYGDALTGRFFKCEDVAAALESFQNSGSEHLIAGTTQMYKMSITDALPIAKKASDCDVASQFNLENTEAGDGEEAGAETADADDEEVEAGGETTDAAETAEQTADGEDDEEADEEEKPAPKRRAVKKTQKSRK